MEKLETKTFSFEIKSTSGDGSEFEGYASAFHNIDDSYWGDIVAPGAFKQDLPLFLSEGFIGGKNHDWDNPIGTPIHAEEDSKGLFVKGKIVDTAYGRDVKVLLKEGVIKKLSIGFYTKGREWLDTSEDVKTYWNNHSYTPTPDDVTKSAYGARLLTRIKLLEFSPVAVPANRMADITDVRAHPASEGGLPAGQRFGDHASMVLDAVGEFIQRSKKLTELRRGEGRNLSGETLRMFKRVRTELDELIEEVQKATSDATTATDPGQMKKLDRLRKQAEQYSLLSRVLK